MTIKVSFLLKTVVVISLVGYFISIIIEAAQKLNKREIGTMFQRVHQETVEGREFRFEPIICTYHLLVNLSLKLLLDSNGCHNS